MVPYLAACELESSRRSMLTPLVGAGVAEGQPGEVQRPTCSAGAGNGFQVPPQWRGVGTLACWGARKG